MDTNTSTDMKFTLRIRLISGISPIQAHCCGHEVQVRGGKLIHAKDNWACEMNMYSVQGKPCDIFLAIQETGNTHIF